MSSLISHAEADRRQWYAVASAPRQIAAALKREILEGVLRPGDRLPSEERLAEMFGVSRPTVRLALQELTSAGTVVVQRGRRGGYRVSQFSLDTLTNVGLEPVAQSLAVDMVGPSDFLEVRRAFELFTAETAARRRSADQLAQLTEIEARVRLMIDQSLEGCPTAPFELDIEFHRALAEATNNPLLVQLEGVLITHVHQTFGSGSTVPADRALGGVTEVIDAVRRRDAVAARSTMEHHLTYSVALLDLGRPARSDASFANSL